jgi:kumamolisin
LIQNGDFELGSASWQEYSSGGFELVDSTNPHSGNYSAYLCGYSNCDDSISQDFAVPAKASSVTVSYWWFGETNHITHYCKDKFSVQLLNGNGQAIGNIQSACNTDATRSWHQVTFNATSLLSKYVGQTVTLVFSATTSSSWVTSSFFVDDVSVS